MGSGEYNKWTFEFRIREELNEYKVFKNAVFSIGSYMSCYELR
jgi:hypothetical protein